MRIKLIFLLLLLFLSNAVTMAQNEKTTVRVGLSNQNYSSQEFENANITSINIIKIIDMSQNMQLEEVEANKTITVLISDSKFTLEVDHNIVYENLKGPLLLSSNAELQLIDLKRKGTPAKYKGMLELRVSKNPERFNIVNIVDMKNYLRGVVPNEMPVSFGLEALKAQAVAARNYVSNASISPNYDVVDSTASQVYYGANSYNPLSDKAVETTSGIYALYNEKPISALYFSTSGGITDDWDDVFGSGTPTNAHPYLKARYDKKGQKPLKDDSDVVDFYSKKDNGLDTNSPKFRWCYEFSRNELENVLRTTLEQQSKLGLVSPKYDGDIPLEGLKELKALKRTQSGKVVELLVKAKSGEYTIKKELGIRRAIKKNNVMLPSANFFVEAIGKETNEEDKNSILNFFEFDEKYPASFKFTGGGFGHGVGMSQFGAYNLAKSGKKYPEILKYYYTNINIGTYPKTVLYNEYGVNYKTEFYYDKSSYNEVYLYISNKQGVSEFPFKVNDYEFLETKHISSNRLVKMNIAPYLKEGLNSITFLPLKRENKGKYVVYRVEFL